MTMHYDLPELKETPHVILGVADNASEETIRKAYLDKIKAYPPERFPTEFEQIRDAYKVLSDPKGRAMTMLQSADPDMPLTNLLEKLPPKRVFLGPSIWLDAMKAK